MSQNSTYVLFNTEKDFLSLLDAVDPPFITNPYHGGKVTCHKCNGFIKESDDVPYLDHQHADEFPKAHFHKDCYSQYEHYYGLDKGID